MSLKRCPQCGRTWDGQSCFACGYERTGEAQIETADLSSFEESSKEVVPVLNIMDEAGDFFRPPPAKDAASQTSGAQKAAPASSNAATDSAGFLDPGMFGAQKRTPPLAPDDDELPVDESLGGEEEHMDAVCATTAAALDDDLPINLPDDVEVDLDVDVDQEISPDEGFAAPPPPPPPEAFAPPPPPPAAFQHGDVDESDEMRAPTDTDEVTEDLTEPIADLQADDGVSLGGLASLGFDVDAFGKKAGASGKHSSPKQKERGQEEPSQEEQALDIGSDPMDNALFQMPSLAPQTRGVDDEVPTPPALVDDEVGNDDAGFEHGETGNFSAQPTVLSMTQKVEGLGSAGSLLGEAKRDEAAQLAERIGELAESMENEGRIGDASLLYDVQTFLTEL